MISEEVLLTEEQMFETWTHYFDIPRKNKKPVTVCTVRTWTRFPKKWVDVGKQEQARSDAFFLFSLLIY